MIGRLVIGVLGFASSSVALWVDGWQEARRHQRLEQVAIRQHAAFLGALGRTVER